MNGYDQSLEISQLIKQRKAELQGIDQQLMEELARQKILEQLMGDGSSRQSKSYENSERTNRMEESGISELSSIGTQEVVDELEKLKMLSNCYKMAHGLPVEQTKASLQDETVPSFTKTHQKKRTKIQMNHQKQSQAQQKWKEIELKQLTEEEIKHEFANFRKTINKNDQQQKQLDKLATLKQEWRQAALAEERYMIRQQLISEQKAKQKLSQQKQITYTVKIHENRSNWLAQPSLLTNPTLKHQRQLKFKSLLGELGGANRRADRIRDQIRTSSFMR